MAYKQNRSPLTLTYFPHLSQAFFLKLCITDREHFIHNQYFRFQMRRNGKRQPYIHTAAISFYGSIQKPFYPGKIYDLIKLTLISERLMPRIAPFRKIFSRPVNSG